MMLHYFVEIQIIVDIHFKCNGLENHWEVWKIVLKNFDNKIKWNNVS